MRAEAVAAETLAPLRGARGAPTPNVTWCIIALCTLVGIVVERTDGGSTSEPNLQRFGALVVPLQGAWWRIFTSTLLHSGFLHLFFNAVGLLIFGRFVEPFYGRARFVAIYLFATITSALSVLVTMQQGLLVGASGAIMGIGGAAVAAVAMRKELRSSKRGRDELKTFALIFGLQIVIDNVVPAISGTAHLGGLIGGALAGAALVPRKK
jgi:rhomboid protease GluP